MRLRALSFIAIAGALALVPLLASGEPQHFDPDNKTALSQYMATILEGNVLYAKKDWNGAIDTFKRAVQLSPNNPLGQYLLGEAYLGANNLGEAEAAFLAAEQVADSKNPLLRAHVLFAVADVYEREKKPEQAVTAWEAYVEHAQAYADAGANPDAGLERLRVTQELVERTEAYAKVRERIANERDAAVDARAKK